VSNGGNKEISFSSALVVGFAIGASKRLFEQINSTFGDSAVPVEIVPVIGSSVNAGVKS
jgi:transketolase C-terminal domain/subunit